MNSACLHNVNEVLVELHERGFFPDCSALVTDSRRLAGVRDVFIALPGASFDPRLLADELIEQGQAGLVFVEHEASRAYHHAQVVPVLNLRGILAELAKTYYQCGTALKVIAVTGTNGKTTVTRWLAQTLTELGQKAGVVGTLGYGAPEDLQSHGGLTTPDVVGLHRVLYHMAQQGFVWACVEASSIGLEQGRMAGVEVYCAAFTNLTQDHLDYHPTMQAYFEAKMRLAAWPRLHCAVGMSNDEYGQQFLNHAASQGAKVTSVGPHLQHAVSIRSVENTTHGVQLSVAERDGSSVSIQVPIPGRFNADNAALVYGVLRALDFQAQQIALALKQVTAPAGRMQSVADAPHVIVDYAHTPDALERVLLALREQAAVQEGRLAVVFGCGGNRDRTKRAPMGRIAATLADRVYITSDNPRMESAIEIINDILVGVSAELAYRVVVQPDRALAIEQAIDEANDQDWILLAGKGHEVVQIVGKTELPFDDGTCAQVALNKKRGH